MHRTVLKNSLQRRVHVHVLLGRALPCWCATASNARDGRLPAGAGFFFGVRRSIRRFAFQDDELLWDPANRNIYQVWLGSLELRVVGLMVVDTCCSRVTVRPAQRQAPGAPCYGAALKMIDALQALPERLLVDMHKVQPFPAQEGGLFKRAVQQPEDAGMPPAKFCLHTGAFVFHYKVAFLLVVLTC